MDGTAGDGTLSPAIHVRSKYPRRGSNCRSSGTASTVVLKTAGTSSRNHCQHHEPLRPGVKGRVDLQSSRRISVHLVAKLVEVAKDSLAVVEVASINLGIGVRGVRGMGMWLFKEVEAVIDGVESSRAAVVSLHASPRLSPIHQGFSIL